MSETTLELTYQQLVFFARQLPLTERVRLVRDILAEPIQEHIQETHHVRSVLDIIESAPGQRLFKTATDVDDYITQERDSWDT